MDGYQAAAARGFANGGPYAGYAAPGSPLPNGRDVSPMREVNRVAGYDLPGPIVPPAGGPGSPMGRPGAASDGLLLPGASASAGMLPPSSALSGPLAASTSSRLERPGTLPSAGLPSTPFPVPALPSMAAYTAGLAYDQGPGSAGNAYGGGYAMPSTSASGPDQFSSLGTWSDLIAGGVVDKPYIEAEAERRKQEIERKMDNELALLENRCAEQCASIKQQAEYHTQMAEKHIQNHKRHHLAHIARQAELQAYSILQRAEMEKGRLGQEACRALNQQSEREKAAVLQEAMRKAEEVWRHSQQALIEQANRAKADIDLQAQRRAEDIEKEAREAVSRVYISPHGPLGAGVEGPGSFVPPLM